MIACLIVLCGLFCLAACMRASQTLPLYYPEVCLRDSRFGPGSHS